MDIMSAYWRYHTPTGGLPNPPTHPRLTRNASSNGREGYDYPPRCTACGLYRPDSSWFCLIARGLAFMPTDLRGGRTQAITTANTEAALYNPAGHLGRAILPSAQRPSAISTASMAHPHSREPGVACRHSNHPLQFNSPSFNPVQDQKKR